MTPAFRTAVITDAASVIGRACADHLAMDGYDLILVDADRTRLNAFADELTTRTRQSVEVVVADAGCMSQLPSIVEKIRQDESIAVLISLQRGRRRDLLMMETIRDLARRGRTASVVHASVVMF